MLRRSLGGLSDRGNKKNVVSIILVSNAFVWYYSVLSSLQSISPPISMLVWVVHFSALILSALVGASFAKRIERPKFLVLWMTLGIAASLTLFAINDSSEMLSYLFSSFLGFSAGFGLPACMSYFTDNVPVESRGRVSGIAMFTSGIGILAFGFAVSSDLLLTVLILGVWRVLSLLVFLCAKDYRRVKRKESMPSFKQVFSRRSFILYFAPWVMFSLINYLAVPMTSSSDPNLGVVQTAFMGGAAVLGGFFVDYVGRKPVAIAGFAMLGLGSAVIGFSGNSLTAIPPLLRYFNSVIDGIAWGFLLVLFVLTLWGDLSHSSSSDKYYALGVMPFFLSKLLELTVGPSIKIEFNTLFSFTAVFLFLAVLPLFYAPETLSEKVVKERQLKIYVEQAQEVAQKYY